MSDDGRPPERFSLKRWSTRKLDAARNPATASPQEIVPPPAALPPTAVPLPAESAQAPGEVPALPPVETLTFESDFTAFLQQGVAEPLKRQALKKLFHDPRFNVMDGLDVYIDDYSVPSPLEPGMLEQMLHAKFTLNPPATRVNAQGYVEDVPPEDIQPEADAEAPPPALAAPEDHACEATPEPVRAETPRT